MVLCDVIVGSSWAALAPGRAGRLRPLPGDTAILAKGAKKGSSWSGRTDAEYGSSPRLLPAQLPTPLHPLVYLAPCGSSWAAENPPTQAQLLSLQD